VSKRTSAHARSKQAEAKKARRRKRLAVRSQRQLFREVLDNSTNLEGVDEVLTERGWEFDVDYSTDEFATWYFSPSLIETDDEAVEPVTRIWVTTDEEWHVIFVGGDETSIDYIFSGESLLENLETIEAYRHGDPAPTFDE
jgi:hypothetical protein